METRTESRLKVMQGIGSVPIDDIIPNEDVTSDEQITETTVPLF